jgi:hypothetical protein
LPATFNTQSGDKDEFMADLGSALTGAGTYYYASRYQFGNMPYIYGGFNGGFWDGVTNVSGVLTVTAATKTLNLTSIFLEGLYAGAGTMNKAQDELGDHFPGTTADQITIELHDATTYSTLVYSAINVNLSTSGTASVVIPASNSGSYYVTIKHRNSIETVSASPVSFAGGTISYAFDAAAQAYGSNLLQNGSYYLIYGGDANQDGLVDSSDMIAVDNDVAAFVAGYVTTDVNGDGLVDSTDMILIDNNSSAFVSKVTP